MTSERGNVKQWQCSSLEVTSFVSAWAATQLIAVGLAVAWWIDHKSLTSRLDQARDINYAFDNLIQNYRYDDDGSKRFDYGLEQLPDGKVRMKLVPVVNGAAATAE